MKKQVSYKLDARTVARIKAEAELQSSSRTAIVSQVLDDYFDTPEPLSLHHIEEIRSILITVLATLFTTVASNTDFKDIELQVANITKHFDRIVAASEVEQ